MAAESKRKPARLTALLLFLMEAQHPVSVSEIRQSVGGYGMEENDESFKRKFRRDREILAQMGITLTETRVVDAGTNEGELLYSLEPGQVVSTDIALSPKETAYLRMAGAQALSSPSFMQKDDLRRALNKLTDALGIVGEDRTDDASPQTAEDFELLRSACEQRRRVSFSYKRADGASSTRLVKPLVLFLFKGNWYLSAQDEDDGQQKSFRLQRMDQPELVDPKAKGPEFPRVQLDAGSLIKLPFQCGREEPFQAQVRFSRETRWKARSCTLGLGTLEEQDDGGLLWTVEANSANRLMQWIIDNAPGIALQGPAEVRELFLDRLQQIAGGA